MAQSLGSIFVDLKANTTDFVAGMSKASYVAKQAGRDIEGVFRNIGDAAEMVLSPLGAAGSEVSEAFHQIGNAAGSAMRAFGDAGGIVGVLTATGAGAAAAIATVTAGALGLAAVSAESTAKLREQAQATGVSVEALTGLGFAAKMAGVSQESLASGLERMARSAFAAATAPAGATNAYMRLGIAVKDSAGNLRSTTSIFEDLATRFAAMPDGISKTALAIQLFGRSGAEMIPLLNEGGDAIDQMVGKARSLGVVVSDQTAEAAHKFAQSLAEIGAAVTGAKLGLMADLLPTLEALGDALTETIAKNRNAIEMLFNGIADLVIGGVGILNTFVHVFEQDGIILEAIGRAIAATFRAVIAAERAAGQLAVFDFSGAEATAKQGLAGIDGVFTSFWDQTKQNWKDNADFINSLLTVRPNVAMPEGMSPRAQGQWRATSGGFTVGEDWLKSHRQQFPADDSAAEAGKKLETTLASVAAKYREEAATAGTSAAAIEDYRLKVLGATAADVARIAALRYQADQANLKVTAPTSPFKPDTSAEAGLKTLRDEYAGLSAAGQKWIDNLNAQRDAAIRVVDVGAPSQTPLFEGIGTSLEQDTASKAKGIIDSLQDQIDAIGQSSLQGDLNKVGAAASPDQTAQIQQLHAQLDLQEAMSRGLRVAGRGPESRDYSKEISQLDELKKALESYGESTLLVDAAIYDANQKLNAQWDEAAMKVGTITQKFEALADQIKLEGANPFEKMFSSLDSSLDELSGKLADFIVTGKNGFKEWGRQLAENMLKIQVQSGMATLAGLIPKSGDKSNVNNPIVAQLGTTGMSGLEKGPAAPAEPAGSIFTSIAKVFGVKGPSSAANPKGTAADPLYVAFAGAGGIAKAPGGSFSAAGLGAPGSATTVPFLPYGSDSGSSDDGSSIASVIPAALATAPQFAAMSGNSGTTQTISSISAIAGKLLPLFLHPGVPSFAGMPSGASPSNFLGLPAPADDSGGSLGSLGSLGSSIWGGLSSAGSSIGSGLASFFSMFAGFFAEGGDVSPGQFHMVGENGPEFFVPGQSGTIYPSASALTRATMPSIRMPIPMTSGAAQTGDTHNHYNVSMNVNGVHDADSFNRSESQIMAHMHAQLARAHDRG